MLVVGGIWGVLLLELAVVAFEVLVFEEEGMYFHHI